MNNNFNNKLNGPVSLKQLQKKDRLRAKKSARNSDPTVDFIMDLQRTVGNRTVARLIQSGILNPEAIQAQLRMGFANDPYEKEADRVARSVVNSSDENMENIRLKTNSITPLAKKTSTAAPGSGSLPVSSGVESGIMSMRGGGRALSSGERSFFENRFNSDFSDVRIHSGWKSNNLNKAINARAFTTGKDIFFADGQYSSGTVAGKTLLAHELTHVVQQRGAVKRKVLSRKLAEHKSSVIQRRKGANSAMISHQAQLYLLSAAKIKKAKYYNKVVLSKIDVKAIKKFLNISQQTSVVDRHFILRVAFWQYIKGLTIDGMVGESTLGSFLKYSRFSKYRNLFGTNPVSMGQSWSVFFNYGGDECQYNFKVSFIIGDIYVRNNTLLIPPEKTKDGGALTLMYEKIINGKKMPEDGCVLKSDFEKWHKIPLEELARDLYLGDKHNSLIYMIKSKFEASEQVVKWIHRIIASSSPTLLFYEYLKECKEAGEIFDKKHFQAFLTKFMNSIDLNSVYDKANTLYDPRYAHRWDQPVDGMVISLGASMFRYIGAGVGIELVHLKGYGWQVYLQGGVGVGMGSSYGMQCGIICGLHGQPSRYEGGFYDLQFSAGPLSGSVFGWNGAEDRFKEKADLVYGFKVGGGISIDELKLWNKGYHEPTKGMKKQGFKNFKPGPKGGKKGGLSGAVLREHYIRLLDIKKNKKGKYEFTWNPREWNSWVGTKG